MYPSNPDLLGPLYAIDEPQAPKKMIWDLMDYHNWAEGDKPANAAAISLGITAITLSLLGPLIPLICGVAGVIAARCDRKEKRGKFGAALCVPGIVVSALIILHYWKRERK